jgi:hypothetical protein
LNLSPQQVYPRAGHEISAHKTGILMPPRKKTSAKRPAVDSKVLQLAAQERAAKERTKAAKEQARQAKQRAKEARKLFKQAKKVAKRAKDELHSLSIKLKGLMGGAADKIGDMVTRARGSNQKPGRKKAVKKKAAVNKRARPAAKAKVVPIKRRSKAVAKTVPPSPPATESQG